MNLYEPPTVKAVYGTVQIPTISEKSTDVELEYFKLAVTAAWQRGEIDTQNLGDMHREVDRITRERKALTLEKEIDDAIAS